MENQLKLNDERIVLREKFKQLFPELMAQETSILESVYQDGVLPRKMKHLIALGIALRAGCENCILSHTVRALESGASKDEILETLAVELAMSGTSGLGESLRVIKILDELGKL
ncbi:MAG: carboxymuconolactone decarboxylase family protein [Dehalococcoidales bacterium]|nr:carboxymuconolactone decarboxylase family protein [Dehalococcoidales bacterium]